MPSLADLVPEIAAYQQQQALGQQRQAGQLAQVGALQGILAKVQAAQKEQALRGALAQLGPDATQDQVAAAARPFVGADDLLRAATNSADRRFTAEQNAASRRDALEARYYDIEARKEDKALGREAQAALAAASDATRRELAQMGFDVRREISAASRADKDKPQAVVGVDAQGRQAINWARPSQGPQSFDTRPPSLTTSGNQQALALRREYNANPEVRATNMLEPRVGPIAEYVASVGKGMGNSVGDAELVKLWLMTTHPKGDQISNLDYRTIEKMPDLYERIKNVAGNFVFGKTLGADTRASMWNSISSKYKSTAAMREKVKADITGRAGRMGIDSSLIFSPPPEE